MKWVLQRWSLLDQLSLVFSCNHNSILVAWKGVPSVCGKSKYVSEHTASSHTQQQQAYTNGLLLNFTTLFAQSGGMANIRAMDQPDLFRPL